MTTTQVAIQPIPYLLFDGKCSEAINFYVQVFHAKLLSKTTLGDMPMCGGAEGQENNPMANEDPNLIMNAQIEFPGGGSLYMGDCPKHFPYSGISGLNITLNYPTVEEGEEVFRALSEGGEVKVDYTPTFWAEKFGMVNDKFGVPWLINGNVR